MMPVLEYQTPRAKIPLFRRIPPASVARVAVRSFFTAIYFAACLTTFRGQSFQCSGPITIRWDIRGSLVVMKFDPVYGRTSPTWSWSWYHDRPGHTQIGSILACSVGYQFLGFRIGHWPYASWFSIPAGPPIFPAMLALAVAWRLTRRRANLPPRSA
jgi:hypothetical protein